MEESPLARAVAACARVLPAAHVERLAIVLSEATKLDRSLEAALYGAVVQPASWNRVRELLEQWREHGSEVPPIAIAWGLRAAHANDTWHREHERIDLVWTGPETVSQGVYRTNETLLGLIEGARRSLLVVTFAAYRVETVRNALVAASGRGVDVCLVVETDEGPFGKVDFGALRELMKGEGRFRVVEWPPDERPREGERYGTLHAKCALADDEVLLVSSANMTGAALALNMELGVLIRGGRVPGQAGKHFAELIRRGVLRPIVVE